MGEVHRQRTCIGTDIPSSQDNVLEMLQALPAESALARGGLKSAERLGCKACQNFSPRGQFCGNHRIITD